MAAIPFESSFGIQLIDFVSAPEDETLGPLLNRKAWIKQSMSESFG